MRKKYSAKPIAVCAVLTALCCVILSLGAVIETLDLSFAVIASLVVWFALLEYGKKAALGIYFPTAVISILLLPSKFPALFFGALTGWYPLVKLFLTKKIKNKILLFVSKITLFNLTSLVLIGFVYFFGEGLGLSFSEEFTAVYFAAMMVLANISFILTDFLMDKLVVVYVMKVRDKLVKMKIVDKKGQN